MEIGVRVRCGTSPRDVGWYSVDAIQHPALPRQRIDANATT